MSDGAPDEGDDDGDESGEVARLERELDRARHAIHALQRLAFALKELVPRAFEEGFRRRVPEREEPWLVDWLQSDAKRALEPLMVRQVRDRDDEEVS